MYKLILLLLIKAAIIVYAIMHAGIGLGPDEAQYWTWSQHPDWGYYSKPPGIAWEIWAGTALFGNTELGVRAMPVLLGFVLPLLIYLLARCCTLSSQAAFWAAAALALAPLGVLASFLAITDVGMIIAWTAVCAYVARKIDTHKMPSYLLIGACVLIGALFKWTMFSFWIAIAAVWIFCPWFRTWKAIAGVAVSLLALLPSIYWNAHHEWATFRHVASTMAGGHGTPKAGAVVGGNPLDFIGAQAALVSPILFVMLVIASVHLTKARKEIPAAVQFCGWLSLAVFAGGIAASVFMKMQGNWIIFAYPTAFVFLAWYAVDGASQAKPWLVAGVVLSAVLCAGVFSLPTVQERGLFSRMQVPYRMSPFRHNVGWENLASVLEEAGYDPEKDFLFGDKYQTASELSFYGPEQKRAYFFNLGGARKNQFSYWPGMPEGQKGKKGYFVVVENTPQLDDAAIPEKYRKGLEPYFGKVSYLGMKPLFFAYGKGVKGALLFECSDYNGLAPHDPELY